MQIIKLLLMIIFLSNTDPSNVRIDIGQYYDYCVIVTQDGNEWLLDEPEEEKVPYEDGQLVIVVFDDLGTSKKTDDAILDIVPIQ